MSGFCKIKSVAIADTSEECPEPVAVLYVPAAEAYEEVSESRNAHEIIRIETSCHSLVVVCCTLVSGISSGKTPSKDRCKEVAK